MMRLRHIKSLVEVDLLQANRQTNNSNENAQKMQKKNIYWRVLLQNALVVLMFIFIFGRLIFNVPLAQFPGIFTETIGFMILFSILQIYQVIYSMFYGNANLSAYLSLPFSLAELFSSKILSLFLTTFAYFMMPFILVTMLGWQTGHSLLLSAPIGLISMLVIMLGTILSILTILHLLHQWSFFRKYNKLFMIAIYILFFVVLLTHLYGNNPDVVPGMTIVDSAINPLFIGFHEIFIPGMRFSGLVKIGLWLIGLSGLIYLTFKWIIPQLYFEDHQELSPKKKRAPIKQAHPLSTQSKWKVLSKYQLRQLGDTTLIIQILFSKYYLPFIMIASFLFTGDPLDLSVIDTIPHLWGAFIIIGASIGFLMVTETSVSGVIISFDKENYHYIQSLPLSFRGYLKFKFYFAFLVEWLLGALAIIGLCFYLKTGILPILGLLAGFTVGTYATSMYHYMRDYRLLDLNWNNFTELMQRGLSQAVRIFIQLFVIIIGTFAIISFLFWFIFILSDDMRFVLSITSVFVLLAIGFSFHKYAENKFWSQFNE